jgi:restriction system protein
MDGDTLYALAVLALIIWAVRSIIKWFGHQGEIMDAEFDREDRRLDKKIQKEISKHRNSLITQRERMVLVDAYGSDDDKNWMNHEIPYFIEKQIVPKLSEEERELLRISKSKYVTMIDATARQKRSGHRTSYGIKSAEFNKDMTGVEYEEFCKDLFEIAGYQVTRTPQSGDQGVDLIVRKQRREIAVQCKRYSRPVGNKAIQEISAGLQYYDLLDGCVLTNATYTPSAKRLAKKLKIKLLHHSQIKDL